MNSCNRAKVHFLLIGVATLTFVSLQTEFSNAQEAAAPAGNPATTPGQTPLAQPLTAPTALPAVPKKLTVIDNIAYRAGSSAAWRLDIAMPEVAGKERLPAIVIVHGGGWSSGCLRYRGRRGSPLVHANCIRVDGRLRPRSVRGKRGN
jgi:acetyl esterase/lipase